MFRDAQDVTLLSTNQQKLNASIWKSRRLSIILLMADIVGYGLCWKLAYFIREMLNPWMGPINVSTPYMKIFPLVVAVAIANCAIFGLYIHRKRLSSLNRPSLILRVSYHWLLYIIVIGFFFKELDLGRSVILIASLLGCLYISFSRTLLKYLKQQAINRGQGAVKCIVIGEGKLAEQVRLTLEKHPEIGYDLLGYVNPSSRSNVPTDWNGLSCLGDAVDIRRILRRHNVEEVFLAIAELDQEEQLELLDLAEYPGLRVHVVSDIFDVITEKAKGVEIANFPVITLNDGHLPLHQAILKEMLDYTAAVAGVIIWMLFFHWWIALVIRMDSKGPIFFRQVRVGRDGKKFQILKYRTMRIDADKYAVAPTAEDDPRVTKFGRWLRKTSLDELPQLWNVLCGEMSMVGPRPEMPFIVKKYQIWEQRRLDVKPGVTGLWQVIGRKNLPLSLNMQYDLYYIKNQSFLLDIEILLKTIPAVLKGKGAF